MIDRPSDDIIRPTVSPRIITRTDAAAYVAVATAATITGSLHSRRVAALTKALPMIILAGRAGRDWRSRPVIDNVLLAGAVAFSMAGDRAMFIEEFRGSDGRRDVRRDVFPRDDAPDRDAPHPSPAQDRWLQIGASLFAGAQTCYIALLHRRGARLRPRHALVRNIVLAESALVLARRRPRLLPVLGGYGTTLATMSAMAADVARPQPQMTIGGALFVASDLTIINRRHLIGDRRWRAIGEAWVLGSYFAAQWLLVTGLASRHE